MTVQQYIKKRPYLVWDIKDPEKLSNESIVVAVLNYGDLDDVKKIIDILGIKKIAKIFDKQYKWKRSNFEPKIANYFKLYFKKYA